MSSVECLVFSVSCRARAVAPLTCLLHRLVLWFDFLQVFIFIFYSLGLRVSVEGTDFEVCVFGLERLVFGLERVVFGGSCSRFKVQNLWVGVSGVGIWVVEDEGSRV